MSSSFVRIETAVPAGPLLDVLTSAAGGDPAAVRRRQWAGMLGNMPGQGLAAHVVIDYADVDGRLDIAHLDHPTKLDDEEWQPAPPAALQVWIDTTPGDALDAEGRTGQQVHDALIAVIIDHVGEPVWVCGDSDDWWRKIPADADADADADVDVAEPPVVEPAIDGMPAEADPYDELLRSKLTFDSASGFDLDAAIAAGEVPALSSRLLPHQVDLIRWAVAGGRRAIFASFGLMKTGIQLAAVNAIAQREGRPGLIVCPLGVRQEFRRDAEMFGLSTRFVRTDAEVASRPWAGEVFVTNYESIREAKLDPGRFVVVSLDEAAVLRSLGTKTFQVFNTLCRAVPYRLVATATPSPNELSELPNYAQFLGVMDKGQSLTRFFKRNSTKAGDLQLMEHRAEEFWAWVASWAVFVEKPSDLGHSDAGFVMPTLDVRFHEVDADVQAHAMAETNGQGVLVQDGTLGVVGAAKVKRSTLTDRVAKAAEIVAEAPDDHFILWHHTEDERRAIVEAIPETVEVYGNLDLDERERRVIAFSDGESRILATKPVLSGSGCNFQRHCHRAVFVGVDFKFADFIQAIHRIQRFGQRHRCRIDIIHADTERQVVGTLRRKWAQHEELQKKMTAIIRDHGLSNSAMAERLARSIGTERVEASGDGWTIVNDDTVRETRRMDTNSVDMIWSSPPYGTQYEYVAAVEDFGHNDDNPAFWRQMDHLTPQLLRVLKPGRMCVFHVKDRIRFGNVTGKGVATVQPFHAEAIIHMIGHGFDFIGEIVLDTDVVRENNQTNRLTWSEVVKDRTKIGVGTPEKILLFRKPQSDRTKGIADEPVVHSKDDYSLARWQIDAAAFWKSSGDRFITPAELEGLPTSLLRKVFAQACRERVYNYEQHVAIGEDFRARGRLPTTFALLALDTDNPLIWADVNRLQSFNTTQARRGAELHVCPSPFDVVDRCINQWSNPGELIFDPFGGLGTVVARALRLGRRGRCNELNPTYWADAVNYARQTERELAVPSLFDLLDAEADAATVTTDDGAEHIITGGAA